LMCAVADACAIRGAKLSLCTIAQEPPTWLQTGAPSGCSRMNFPRSHGRAVQVQNSCTARRGHSDARDLVSYRGNMHCNAPHRQLQYFSGFIYTLTPLLTLSLHSPHVSLIYTTFVRPQRPKRQSCAQQSLYGTQRSQRRKRSGIISRQHALQRTAPPVTCKRAHRLAAAG
jgi:hypothetical protein